jgi:hypothetical protein
LSGFPVIGHGNPDGNKQVVRHRRRWEKNIIVDLKQIVSRGSAVGIATAYGLDDREVGVRVPVGSEFSLLHEVQTGSGAHSASHLMGTGGSFPGGKVAGT